jgi:hypothetical protein
MFSLPSLPTESLHKFKALSGIAIIGFSIFYFTEKMDEAWLELINLEHDVSRFEIEKEPIFERTEKLKQTTKEMGRLAARVEKATDRFQEWAYSQIKKNVQEVDSLGKLADTDGDLILKDAQVLSLKDIEIQRRLSILSYSEKKLWLYGAVLLVCIIAGYTLIHDGFKEWEKQQRAIDDAILKQAGTVDT